MVKLTSSKIFLSCNIILLAIGVGVICGAIDQKLYFDKVEKVYDSTYSLMIKYFIDINLVTNTLIISGITLCLVTIIGFLCLKTQNTCCLKLYLDLGLIICGCMIVITTMGYVKISENISLNDAERFIADNFNDDKYNDTKRVIDLFQSELYCCGKTGKENYFDDENFPSSCCLPIDALKNQCYENAFKTGCINKASQIPGYLMKIHQGFIKKIDLNILLNFGILVFIIQLIAVKYALFLIWKFTCKKKATLNAMIPQNQQVEKL